MLRTKPLQRRPALVCEFHHGGGLGMNYILTIGVDQSTLRINEVFVECSKRSNDMDDVARDFGLLLSIALQHGIPWEEIKEATKNAEGTFLNTLVSEAEQLLKDFATSSGTSCLS